MLLFHPATSIVFLLLLAGRLTYRRVAIICLLTLSAGVASSCVYLASIEKQLNNGVFFGVAIVAAAASAGYFQLMRNRSLAKIADGDF